MLAFGEGVKIRVKYMLTHFIQLEKEIVYERYKIAAGLTLGFTASGMYQTLPTMRHWMKCLM